MICLDCTAPAVLPVPLWLFFLLAALAPFGACYFLAMAREPGEAEIDPAPREPLASRLVRAWRRVTQGAKRNRVEA